MSCFVSLESNSKKPDPEPSSGRQQRRHPHPEASGLGVIVALILIITSNIINKTIFLIIQAICFNKAQCRFTPMCHRFQPTRAVFSGLSAQCRLHRTRHPLRDLQLLQLQQRHHRRQES